MSDTLKHIEVNCCNYIVIKQLANVISFVFLRYEAFGKFQSTKEARAALICTFSNLFFINFFFIS